MNPKASKISFEVVQTGAAEIVGQSRSNIQAPGIGSLILTGNAPTCVGVVHNTESISLDPHRRPAALGLSKEELRIQYPQLSVLMRSQFQALLVGTLADGRFLYGLPTHPPEFHDEIRLCDEEAIRAIGAEPAFLRLIHASGKTHAEELILAVCKTLIEAFGWRHDETVRIGKAISELYRDDYETLRRLLSRMETWLQT